MKDNIWKKGFKTEHYNIKDLGLENNMELSILKDEALKYWDIKENGNMLLNVDLIKKDSCTPEFKEFLQRAELLLSNILDDADERLATIKAYEVFTLLPDIWNDVREYKESLKKK